MLRRKRSVTHHRLIHHDMIIQLNIGSNIADRYAQIEQAVGLLSIAFRHHAALYGEPAEKVTVSRSHTIETEPEGFSSPNPFLNLGVKIEMPDVATPEQVLDITQGVEQLICPLSHRNPDGSYRDRRIDIDIIDIDGISHSSPRLILPHPRAGERYFVQIPLQELRIDLPHHLQTL